jgi:hypothetical protein
MKPPARTAVFLALLIVANAANFSAQQPTTRAADAETRAREIAAAFTKNKQTVKTKRGVRHEKYKKVTAELVTRADPRSLSGTYEVDDFGLTLRLEIDRDGRVTGSGEEVIGDGISRTFTISNGRLVGALLTGVKVFPTGRTDRFEGAFLKRTSYESPEDKGFSRVGVGMLGRPLMLNGSTFDRFFYALRAPGRMQTADLRE